MIVARILIFYMKHSIRITAKSSRSIGYISIISGIYSGKVSGMSGRGQGLSGLFIVCSTRYRKHTPQKYPGFHRDVVFFRRCVSGLKERPSVSREILQMLIDLNTDGGQQTGQAAAAITKLTSL